MFALRLAWKNYQLIAIENPAKRAALLKKMIDLLKAAKELEEKAEKTPAPVYKTIYKYLDALKSPESIRSLIKFSSDIQAEDDIAWFCDEFKRLGYKPPLEKAKSLFKNASEIKWLPILIEANLRPSEIEDEAQFINFIRFTWSGKEVLNR